MPTWLQPRSGATPPAACGRSPSRELPTYLDLPSLYSRYLGSLPGGMRGDGDGRVHAHRFGHEDAAGLARRARCRGRHHPLRQQRGQPGRPALFGDAAPLPGSETAVCRGADRMDPLRPRAGRRRLGDAPGLEQLAADCPEPPPSYYRAGQRRQLLLQGSDRRGDARRGRAVDNVVFETDYPHSDSTWPDSRRAASEQFGHLDPDSVREDRTGERDPTAGARPAGRPSAAVELRGSAGPVWRPGRRRSPTPSRAWWHPSAAGSTRPPLPHASPASRSPDRGWSGRPGR